MMFLQLLPIFCALLFAFTRKINIRVAKHDELTVKIIFNIIAIILTEEKLKKNGIKRIARGLKSFRSIIKPCEYLIKRSEFRVYRCTPASDNNNLFSVLLSISIWASTGVVFSLLKENARSIKFIENRNNSESTHAAIFEFSIHFSLLNLFIFTAMYLYYTMKNKIKRVIKNV